jgi:hypothetical protein
MKPRGKRSRHDLLVRITLCQTIERHILRNDIVRNQDIRPRLPAIALGVVAGVLTPTYSGITLRKNLAIHHLIGRLRLKHENSVFCLRYEIRLILGIIGLPFIVDLELAFRGLKPLRCLAFQNDGQFTFGVRLELLNRVRALAARSGTMV